MIVEPDRGPKRPFKLVPGANAEPMHLTGMTSTRSCRLSASKRPMIREKMDARPCAGFVHEADVITIGQKRANARHALRRMQKGTQRRYAS